jgi:hypothetical protein
VNTLDMGAVPWYNIVKFQCRGVRIVEVFVRPELNVLLKQCSGINDARGRKTTMMRLSFLFIESKNLLRPSGAY